MEAAPWAWAAVVLFIVAVLLVDLVVFHRDAHAVSFKEATAWSIVWIALGLAFGLIVWAAAGPQSAGEYYAGYIIEKSLSVDNIFVFALIFGYFAVPAESQHRVLFWGVFGALVLRAVFIAAGAAILEQFHWAIYVFGGILLVTGVRMALHKETEVHPERNLVLRGVRRVVPMTNDYEGQKFLVRHVGRLLATPMLAVLVVIETTDVIFAVDSIPAIFAVTRDTFIVFTSNAFAILGLRALYFLLAGMIGRFVYLKPALAIVLIFVGIKMLISEVYKIPILASLGFIGVVLTVGIVASLLRAPPEEEELGAAEADVPTGEVEP